MKKVIVLLLSLLLVACSNNSNAGMPNPNFTYSSLDEINEIVGTNLVDLKEYGEITDEVFTVIDNKIAEYQFKIDGFDICFRGSKVLDEDISGVYIEGKPAFEDFDVEMSFNYDDNVIAHRFMLGDDCQYSVSSTNRDDPKDVKFLDYITELETRMLIKLSNPDIKDLLGEYQDEVSQRAYGAVYLYTIDHPWLEMAWSSSATEEDEWLIELTYEGNGKYSFSESLHYHLTYTDEGEIADDEFTEEAISGYIEFKDNKIYMNNSNLEPLQECIFVKIG